MASLLRKIPLPRQSYVFFMAILALLLILLWTVFKPFVILMVTGVFVAVLALPIDKFWEKRLPNRVAAILTMFTLFVIIAVPIAGLGFALANDAEELSNSIQEGKHEAWITDAIDTPLAQRALELMYPGNTTDERNASILRQFDDVEAQALVWLQDFGRDVATALPTFFIALTVIMFVVYYVLIDGARLVTYMKKAAPLPQKQVHYLLEEARIGVRGVFIGQIMTSLIQGGLGGIGFLIVGLPGAIVWAAVMAVLSLLPVVGAFIVWIPAALFMFMQAANGDVHIWKPLFLTAWGVIVVSQVDNFIRPKLIGDRAKIHPIFVLIGVLGGVAAFGFIGLFLGPLIVGVTLAVLKVWEDEYLDPIVGLDDPTSDEESE